MSKWDELKRLAETAISLREHGRTSEGEPEWDEADDAFWNAITPELITELIAENVRLRRAIRNSIECDFHEIARDMLIGQAKSHDLYAACERLEAALGEEVSANG